MTNMPKFNFKPTLTEQDMQKIEQETSAQGGKFFQPGQYDLTVKEFAHNVTERNPNGTASGDPSWLVYKLVLGDNTKREITSYVLIPTRDERYLKPGIKSPLFMMGKLREFLRGLGVEPNQKDIGAIVNNLITAPERVTGLVMKTVIGYSGHHLVFDPTTKAYQLLNGKGAEVIPGQSFPDRNSAIAAAAEYGIDPAKVQMFAQVKRFQPADAQTEEETTSNDWN